MPGVKDWLKKASNDLKASKKLSDDNETFDCSVFHTHQCAEKVLKAFIVSVGEVVPKTHDLSFLLARCVEIDSLLLVLFDDSKSLDKYGYDSRYPNDRFYVDQYKVLTSIEVAERIFFTIKNKVNKG